MKLVQFFIGDQHKREMKRLAPLVDRINSLEVEFEKLTDEALRAKTSELRQRFSERVQATLGDLESQLFTEPDEMIQNKIRQRFEQHILDELIPEAFATVREASKRVLGMRHFDVQLLGGMVLHSGKIAEMRTGEGKTLVATLPAYLNAIAGHGVHIVTVNDYLAKRDAQWMGKLYNALGMSVGAIGHEQSWQYATTSKSEISHRQGGVPPRRENPKSETNSNDQNSEKENLQPDSDWPNLAPVSRQEAYAADITYGTNNEFGFDYLRDNMAQQASQLVQRPLWYAIVDEVDSILIDEARTPLIISAPAEESTNLYQTFAAVAKRLKKDIDYTVDEKFRSVTITDVGIGHVEDWIGIPNLYAPEHVQLVHHMEEALKAQGMFNRNKDYVVREGEVVIVDEFTGRMMPGRRYSEGLHQAIEAKEGVEIKRESDTLATISFQNLFRLYAKLSGMTGTAITESEEFWKIYQIDVIQIPTHRAMVRIDHQDYVFKTEAAKLQAVIKEIKKRTERGQPVLVGTVSVDKNERLSRLLKQAGVKHQLLNAKHHEREAKIITNAGKPGAVTVATNMAGRGVDILLGGEPPKSEDR
ncbi:MAG: preprotein translocase subunit SecA, partial [Patescibacteria group bacterium]